MKQIPTGTLQVGNKSGILYKYEKGGSLLTTRINVASASKWVSSSLFMTLVRDGIMSLNDRPGKYLPWWTSSPSDPRYNITLKKLLSFTSGLADGIICPCFLVDW
jgi:CubicO group peptidase (beta-lactamase class C family)